MSLILSGTDGLSDVDGTAATPAIRGTDTNTGIFFPAADTVAASVGGTEGLRLTTTGLGVGRTPNAKLDVEGAGIVRGFLTTTDAIKLGGNTSAPSSTDSFIYRPADNTLAFGTASAERLRLDSSGNLGLGVTPSAWGAPFRAFQFGPNGGSINARTDANQAVEFALNWYYDGSTSRYINTNFATRYRQFSGAHEWYTAPSGTAGNAISFTQAMTLDSSGRLLVGTTTAADSNAMLNVYNPNATSAQITLQNTTTGVGSNGSRLLATGNDLYITNKENGFMAFETNDTERARITSGGAFLVGTSTGTYTGAGCINSTVATSGDFCFSGVNTNATNPRGLYLRSTNTTAGDYAIYFEASAATKFYVNGNGVIYSTNTSVQSVSDGRHKENVRDLDKGLAEVLALKPRRFDWKEGKGTGAKDVAGFIAQEVEAVLPELVGEWKESVDAEETFKSIGMANVIPMLVKAIQEQQAIIESLTARITALEAK